MNVKLLKKIEAEGLISLMNQSKWRALVTEMLEGGLYRPDCLIKYLDDPEPLGPSPVDWVAYSGGANMNQIELMALDSYRTDSERVSRRPSTDRS